MMKALVIASAILAAAPAFAETAPYAPITISEQDYRALQTYLGDQPMKFSAPIAAWLTSREQQASAARKAADDATATTPKP